MEKKNCKQEQNTMKAMKQCGKAAMDSGCGVGAIVSLKVDYRTNCHAPGLLAIAFAVRKETGGIRVCCEHGIITHNGRKGDYWFPYDKYKVIAISNATLPIAQELQSLRDMVLAGKYNSQVHTIISYSTYVDKEMNSTSPVQRAKGCGFKKGCGKNCGCKKKGVKCHSGCMCNGNCDHTGV
jgi:hypothetical protein